MRDHLSEIQHARRIVDLLRRALLHGDHVGEEFAEAVDHLNQAVTDARQSGQYDYLNIPGVDIIDRLAAPSLDEDGR